MLTALVLPLALAGISDVAIIAPDKAREYVGQDVVVLGQVAQVGVSVEDGHTLLLNFGAPYPFHVFNALVFRGNLGSFPEARSWEGKVIQVRGKIQLYKGNGKPEIILERREQVTIDSSTTLTQGAVPGSAGDVVCDVAGGAPGGVPLGTGNRPVMDFDSPPKVVKQVRPQYPQDAFVMRIEGTVLVEALVDTQGRVDRARVIQSVPLLDSAALQACCQWVFQPAMKQGHPVATIIHMPVRFLIDTKLPEQQKQRKQRPVNNFQ